MFGNLWDDHTSRIDQPGSSSRTTLMFNTRSMAEMTLPSFSCCCGVHLLFREESVDGVTWIAGKYLISFEKERIESFNDFSSYLF